MVKRGGLRVVYEPSFGLIYRREERLIMPPKVRQLLQFLIENRHQRFSRKVIEKLLWPQASRVNAQRSLRQLLHIIGKLLGDLNPIRATRTKIFCLSSLISVPQRVKEWGHILVGSRLNQQESARVGKEQILAAFRREPIAEFLPKVQRASKDLSVDPETRNLAQFFLAFSYNELNQEKLALRTAFEMLANSKTHIQKSHAHHAVGGILWHAGRFKDGISHLWKAHRFAGEEPGAQMHILTNIAIGEYEHHRTHELSYAVAHAEQINRAEFNSDHSFVMDYVRSLDMLANSMPSLAMQQLRRMVAGSVDESHRLMVYAYEALCQACLMLDNLKGASEAYDSAMTLRKTFNMVPSAVERQRLATMKRALERLSS